MRLELILNHRPDQVLPINYQYLISSWIYNTLGNANEAFASKLHNHGYDFAGKNYKLFTFGPLIPAWYQVDKRNRTFILAKSPTRLVLSFHMDEAMQYFVMGLFKNQSFQLKSGRLEAQFEVAGIEMLPKPLFQDKMRFRLKTPLCLSRKEEGSGHDHATYISPVVPGYGESLVQNLFRKQLATRPKMAGAADENREIDFAYGFELCSEPKSKLFSIKGIQVRGYMFDFELEAPVELMEVGYFGGFGEKGSGVGMGMVRVLE